MASKLFPSGDTFYESVREDIMSAEKEIKLEMYKFNLSGIGKLVAEDLIAKSEQGVKISILVDGIGSKNWGGSLLNTMEKNGIRTKIYHPIPWQFHHFKHAVSNLPTLKKFFYLFAKINTRNHRKMICIDRKIVYLGSINISDDHISKNNKSAWADCAIRIEDKNSADTLITAFSRAWSPDLRSIYQGLQQTLHDNSPIILNNNLVKRKQNFRRLLKQIKKARTRLWLVSAYFTPNNTLLRSLIDAANRGVDVRLIIPKESDVPFVNLAARYFYTPLIKANIKVLEYLPTMMHSKYIIIDEFAMVGTSNLNHRSIMHDLEVDYRTNETDLVNQLENLFIENEKMCQLVVQSELSSNIITKALCRFIISFKIVL